MKYIILILMAITLSGCDHLVWAVDKRCQAKGGQLIYREALTPSYLCIKAEVIDTDK